MDMIWHFVQYMTISNNSKTIMFFFISYFEKNKHMSTHTLFIWPKEGEVLKCLKSSNARTLPGRLSQLWNQDIWSKNNSTWLWIRPSYRTLCCMMDIVWSIPDSSGVIQNISNKWFKGWSEFKVYISSSTVTTDPCHWSACSQTETFGQDSRLFIPKTTVDNSSELSLLLPVIIRGSLLQPLQKWN